jgi:hypothetical protein
MRIHGVRQALLHGSYLGLVTNSYVFKKGKTFIYQDKKMPQKHRVRNWKAYNKALKLMGDLFLYFDENFLKNEDSYSKLIFLLLVLAS